MPCCGFGLAADAGLLPGFLEPLSATARLSPYRQVGRRSATSSGIGGTTRPFGQIWQRVTGRWVTVAGKRRELEVLVTSVMPARRNGLAMSTRMPRSLRVYVAVLPWEREDGRPAGRARQHDRAIGEIDRLMDLDLARDAVGRDR